MKYSREFLQEMPKTDLHLHLDGSLRLETLIESAQKLNIKLPSYTVEGLKEKVFKENFQNLQEYISVFQYTCAVLRDLEIMEKVSYELAIDNQNEGVNYIEVRFAPQLLMNLDSGPSFNEVMSACHRGLDKAKKEYNNTQAVKSGEKPEFDYGIICCAMRQFKAGFSDYYKDFVNVLTQFKDKDQWSLAALELVRSSVKARDELGIPIVGLDIAGQEDGAPPKYFKQAYEFAHKNFLRKTVHAGEAYGAESIFEAITTCYAERLGHGLSLFIPEMIQTSYVTNKNEYLKQLSSFIADRRIVIEVCLSSNRQTNPAFRDIKQHKLKDMLDQRHAVSICTDNRLVSHTTVTNEYFLATQNFDIPMKRLKDIVAYGFKKNFYPGDYVTKRDYAKRNMLYFDKIAKKHGLKV